MNRQRSTDQVRAVARTRPRRAFTALIAAAILFGLSACGGAESSDGGDGAGESAGTGPESPIALGDSAEIWGWDVAVTGVELDATATIMSDTGLLAEEPEPGHQFAKVVYEGTYRGDDPDNSFHSDLVLAFWIDGVAYDDCGPNFPAELYTGGPVAEGETVTSAFCAQIPVDRSAAVLLNVKDWQPTGQTGFFFATE
ncbi:hypothetical protein [Glycomyces tenuis]|uniref:hypothetical protein n=1 Tax=Glycomyces tenuis TaxID=58116 RepID=UPI00040E9FCD|nr:hypothetical protein [Glycomyces tenuis]